MFVVETLKFGVMKTKPSALNAARNGNDQTKQPRAWSTANTPTNAEA